MLNENAKKWVAALRSGEYKQGRGALRSCSGSYCCLGVGCDLANPDRWEPSQPLGYYNYEGQGAVLTPNVTRFLGLSGMTGSFLEPITYPPGDEGDVIRSLADLNDAGASFEEIADFIESEPDGLFDDGGSR